MAQTTLCPNCRTENPVENLFCYSCGTRFSPPASTAQGQQNYSSTTSSWDAPAATQSIYTPNQGANFGTYPLDKLGTRLDGWADLVGNAAENAESVQAAFSAELQRRQMPYVSHPRADLTPGGLVGKRRSYQLSQSYTGATMAVYIGPFGCDLFVVWDLYQRIMIKWRNIAIMAGVAAVLAIFAAYSGRFYFEIWIFAFLGWALLIALGASILGAILRGSRKAFFIEELDTFSADDITAMMFAVHQSLLSAIDTAGIDASLLRPKEHFAAGRKERII